MAIRLRLVKNTSGSLTWVALCAARSMPKEGDVYIDDAQHSALSNKFARDFNSTFNTDIPGADYESDLVDIEESNNSNREDWDRTFGGKSRD